jgi:methylamine--corrinoid protein Co-methyltransferase
MTQSYAQESVVDTLVNGVLNTIEGEPVIPGSPREIKAVKTEQAYVRIACQLAGRPGMGI